METTAFRGSILTRTELQTLVATKLENLNSFPMQNATMEGIEETLAKAIDVGFKDADTAVKNAFFRFINMTLTGLEQQRLMHTVIQSIPERWTQSEILVDKLSEKVCRHPILMSCIMESTNFKESEGNLDEHGSNFEHKAHVDLSSTVSDNDTTQGQECICYRPLIERVAKTTQQCVEKAKSRSPSTSPTHSEVD